MKNNKFIQSAAKAERLLVLAAGLSTLLCVPAQAHFLWGKITDSSTPRYHLTFSEDGDSKTSADLLPKITPARAFTADGRAVSLKSVPTDGELGAVLPTGTSVVGARQTWGVFGGAPKLGIFLLRYDAKAAVNETSAGESAGLPVEISATRSGNDLIAHVVENGKSSPSAEVWVNEPGLDAPLALTTDANGDARFAVQQPGECFIRAMVADAGGGSYDGQHYELTRNYSTLTFPVSEVKTEPAAYALLKDAHDHRETFSSTFPGMTASITLDDNGTLYTGKVASDNQDDATVQVEGLPDSDKDWIEDQMENLIGHRRGGDFAQGEGKCHITYGSVDHSPLGQQVVLHDDLRSSYRVRDHQIIDVTRTMMGQKFSITVLDSIKTDDGKFLPHEFNVTYFDPKTGAIDHVDAYSDAYTDINGEWLPTSRRVITAKDGTFTTRILTLSDIAVAQKS